MTLGQKQQFQVEEKQPLVKRENNSESINGTNLIVNELDDDCGSIHSHKPLIDGNDDETDNEDAIDYDEDSEEEIDTRVRGNTEDVPYEGMRKVSSISSHGRMGQSNDSLSMSNGKVSYQVDDHEDISGSKTSLHRGNSVSSVKSLKKSSSKNELLRMQSMDRQMESLERERSLENSTSFTTPPPLRQSSSVGTSDTNEQSRLLRSSRPMSTSTGYGTTADAISDVYGDEDSIRSMFRGALDVDVLEIPWESDIYKVVDVQTGKAEWETSINPVEGGLCVDGWDTNIIEMSKEADKLGPDIWSTAIRELPKDIQLHEEWGTEIAGKMTNDADPIDWSTKFNAIKKVEPRKNIWTTMMRKIQNRSIANEKWKTKFNGIGADPPDDGRKSGWKFKIPKQMQNLSLKTDWSTRINRTEKSVEGEAWKNKFNDMLLQCGDRDTHWNTKFLSIQKNEEHLNTWNTSFREIAPPDMDQPETWATTFYPISEERDMPEHWNTKFLSIEQPVDENDWSVTIEDIPDDFKEASDWSTGFNRIENHENNELWDTLFSSITKDHASERIWTSAFLETDNSDITQQEWDTNFNAIDKADIPWEVSVNPIINHPTNHPVDKD